MLGWICLCVSFLYLCLCGLLFLLQRSMLYHPTTRSVEVPALTLAVNAAELVISTNQSTSAHAVLYFGGNAEDVSSAVEMLGDSFPTHALYAMHYRSYGGSTGKPTERALVSDALALYDFVAKKHAHISVIGRSLGSGIAVQIAATRPVRHLVLVTPYYSIVELASELFKWLPIRLMLQDCYESWRYVPQITAPTTVLIAAEDNVIPIPSSLKLAQSFPPAQIKTVLLQGQDHNSISATPEYTAALREAIGQTDVAPSN